MRLLLFLTGLASLIPVVLPLGVGIREMSQSVSVCQDISETLTLPKDVWLRLLQFPSILASLIPVDLSLGVEIREILLYVSVCEDISETPTLAEDVWTPRSVRLTAVSAERTESVDFI